MVDFKLIQVVIVTKVGISADKIPDFSGMTILESRESKNR